MAVAALGICWQDAGQAAAHVCGHSFPAVAGGRLVACTGFEGGVLHLAAADLSTGAVDAFVQPLSLPACDPVTWWSGPAPWGISAEVGAVVAAAVLAVWFVGWGFRAAIGVLRDRDTD